MTDLDLARQTLHRNPALTCVLVRQQQIITSTKTGISPMLDFIAEQRDLRGFSVADRIVGKAAAMLFVHAGIAHAHAEVVSQAALDYGQKARLDLSYDTLVTAISNRQHDGPCPMEQTVLTVQSPLEAYHLLLRKRAELAQAKNS